MIRTPCPFQLEHKESAGSIDRQDIDWADRCWELNTVSARRVYVNSQSLPLHINGADVLRDEIAQLELETELDFRRFGFLCINLFPKDHADCGLARSREDEAHLGRGLLNRAGHPSEGASESMCSCELRG